MPSGFDLFLRFAEGCRHYMDDRGTISPEDSREVYNYLHGNGPRPSEGTLRRVYYVAWPGLRRVSRRLRRGMFDIEVVREFYAFDHNKMKLEQGNLICIAYPARVIKVNAPKDVLIDLEPVRGTFRVETSMPLKVGDWVMTHRMQVIERVDIAFAGRAAGYLRELGLDKTRKFPRKAYKYLTDLRFSGTKA